MAENDAGDRTEDPTAKKRQDALKKGQVARSKELNSAALLIAAGLAFTTVGAYSSSGIMSVLGESFSISRAHLYDTTIMLKHLGTAIESSFLFLTPIFLIFYLTAAISPVSIGGFSFSMKAASPKASNMSPKKGFKRMFGPTAGMELVKSIGKFTVVGGFAIFYLSGRFGEFMTLGHGAVLSEITRGLEILVNSFLVIALSLLLIAAIDVPFQLWNHKRQLKMTKQEVKDEHKDTEGRPEVKGRIRQTQRELANRRMMEAVPEADVVITNPEHFSVALKYDDKMIAPVVVAKGTDEIALKIRQIAKAHEVPMFAAPPLARAIFYNTKLNRAIPEGLYLAVAQVLAYVFQLKEFRKGKGRMPDEVADISIPTDLKR
ncbi:MAG: flagellar biosynthesis protein FlhB [Gammaproteobacteria bacterium]|nr:MAG: flagellar biosynthesis protein FlhB [Gammaproteobacteria bacterium]